MHHTKSYHPNAGMANREHGSFAICLYTLLSMMHELRCLSLGLVCLHVIKQTCFKTKESTPVTAQKKNLE